MDGSERTAQELLAHLGWLRALARGILDDRDDADDVAQEAWLTATSRAPANPDALRGWLSRIVRNLALMRGRSGRRRSQRELASQRGEASHADSAELLLDQARVQHLLATLVLGLAEPYRSVVLLHFYEGLSAAEIARREGIPASTVRGRLSQALGQLRRGLDAEAGGDRRRWAIALAPIANKPTPATAAATGGALSMKLGLKLGLLAALLLLVAGASRVVRNRSSRGPGDPSGHGSGSWLGWLRGTGGESKAPGWLVQPGAEPRRIAGTVLFHEAPVQGATVQLFDQLVYAGGLSVPTRVTDEQGRFDFGPQPPAFITLIATAPGRSADFAGVEVANPAARPRPDQIEMRLGDCAAPLDGQVRDASGGVVAGASVCLGIDGGLPAGCVTADVTGHYELCLNVAGPFSVRVAAQGYGAVLEDVPGHWSRLTRNFALTPEAVVRGTVVRAGDGKPQPGAWVALASATSWSNGPAPIEAITDGEGRFVLAGVAGGRHRLSAQSDTGVTLQDTDVTVHSGATLEGVVLRVAELPTVRGTITEAGRAVAGASVQLQSASSYALYSAKVFSQADGSFVMPRAPRGASTVQSYSHQILSPKVVQVGAGGLNDVHIEVAPQTVVHGHVRRAGKPAAHVWVQTESTTAVSTTTDASGEFSLRGAAPGALTIIAVTEEVKGRAKVTVGRGETVGVDIDLDASATIAGVVVEEDGRPVPGVAVLFSQVQGADQAQISTGSDGTFRVGPLVGAGTYRAGVRPDQKSLIVIPPATAFPEVTLRDGGSQVEGVRLVVRRSHHKLTGRVIGPDGAPRPDAEVIAVKREDAKPLRFVEGRETARTTTGQDGTFELADLDAGDYGLRARVGAGPEAVVEHVDAGAASVNLKLPPAATIAGRLVGFASAPEVMARRAGATDVIHATVGADGFTFGELPAGKYVVSTAAAESDVATVDLAAGVTAQVSLTRREGGTVRGRVVDVRTGKPVSGIICNPWVGPLSYDGMLGLAGASVSDDDGRFELPVSSGQVLINCAGDYMTVSTGAALVTVAEHQAVEAEVLVVRRQAVQIEDKVWAWIGTQPERETFGYHVRSVKPGSPADRAGVKPGDHLASIDGVPLDHITVHGALTLLDDRPLGAAFPVQVARGATTFAASLSLVPQSQ